MIVIRHYSLLIAASLFICSSVRAQHGHDHASHAGTDHVEAEHLADHSEDERELKIGAVLDLEASFQDAKSDDEQGFDFRLRSFELSANAVIDSNARAYAVIGADEDEIVIEEAAVHYSELDGLSLGNGAEILFGRFYLDFGQQMQNHLHDLPTPERPLVLRSYLGSELVGTGVQYGDYFSLGTDSSLRYSIGLFDSLESHEHGGEAGHEHGEEEEGAHVLSPERRDLDELSLSARLSAYTKVSDSQLLHAGLSARHVPGFAFVDEEESILFKGLSNTVLGVDVEYVFEGHGPVRWTLASEYLHFTGDLALAEDVDGAEESIQDEAVEGFYLWGDYRWSEQRSAGILYSAFEHPDDPGASDAEATLYYTQYLSDSARLRFALTQRSPEEGDDQTLFLVQFTSFLGGHAHADVHRMSW